MNRPPPPPPEGFGRPAHQSMETAGSRSVEYQSASGTRSRDPEPVDESYFLGRYRVVSEIGRGGMASVHLSRIDGPGGFAKWVALKRIHPHLVENDQRVEMFLDEARMAAGISHPNVAQVFDLGKDKDTYWIAMEYLHGEPVRELIRAAEEQQRAVPAEIVVRIIADAAEGLHAAHELRGKNGELLNLVHRDVTPHNLFVTYDGYTKVVDFGIAKAAGRLASTNAGELKGKLAYMAPEQIKNQELDRRTDVFALGIVLWEMTTNRRLFRSDTDLDTLEKVQACVVPPPSSIVPGYSKHLEEIVLTALARDKEDRYQTARAFSRALQTFLRRNTFVGFEEVGEVMKKTFADRIARRNDHLAWASEITSSHPPEPRTEAEPDDEASTLQEEDGSAVTADFRTDVMNRMEPGQMLEDEDDAATLIARNPSKYLEAIVQERPSRKSDATQLLPSSGRLARTEPPPSRPPLSHRSPQSMPSREVPRAPVPSSTSMHGDIPRAPTPPTVAMGIANEFTPSSRNEYPRAVVSQMFPNEPSVAPSSGEPSVPAGSVGFRAPANADPSITAPNPVPATLFDRDRPSAYAIQPRIPQNAIETQMSAERVRQKRNTLGTIVWVLAILCAITFVVLIGAIARTLWGF